MTYGTGEEMITEGMTVTMYAHQRQFNGQLLSLGRTILYGRKESSFGGTVVPATVHGFRTNEKKEVSSFETEAGEVVEFDAFVADPNKAVRADGRVDLHLEPGQWCFPPRV